MTPQKLLKTSFTGPGLVMPSLEQGGLFKNCDLSKVQPLNVPLLEMDAGSLNYWITKFVQEVAKPSKESTVAQKAQHKYKSHNTNTKTHDTNTKLITQKQKTHNTNTNLTTQIQISQHKCKSHNTNTNLTTLTKADNDLFGYVRQLS